jgi:prepilin-type N-terminal cleavage/methylation domain-containing protein
MARYHQSGYTLVEVAIVTALVAVMVAAVLGYQANGNRATAFSTDLDSVNAKIAQVQTEANSNVLTQPGAGTRSNVQIFGKMVEFYGAPNSPNARIMRVSTLISYDDAGRLTDQGLSKCDQYTAPLGGVEWYDPTGSTTNQAIIFKTRTSDSPAATYAISNYAQSPSIGLNSTCSSLAPLTPSVGGNNALSYSSYPSPAFNAPVTLNFRSVNTMTGRITVTPGSGSISRSVP